MNFEEGESTHKVNRLLPNDPVDAGPKLSYLVLLPPVLLETQL